MRTEIHKTIHRIVIKIGTSSLTHANGRLSYRRMERMVSVICDLKNIGYEIILVSSGAVGVGLGKTNLSKKPQETVYKRALAAIGQSNLMAIYEELFSVYDCQISQILLTKSILQNKKTIDNIASAFSILLKHYTVKKQDNKDVYDGIIDFGTIPIVNENDVVISDNSFGDNDTLSAYVARFIKADLLIIWSDIDGLYDKDPRINKDAKIVPMVTNVNKNVYKMAGGTGTSRASKGTGGMITKLNAARIAMEAGINMVITNGDEPENLYEILEGKQIGTYFCASRKKS